MEPLYASLIRAAVRDDDTEFDRIVDEVKRTNASAEFLGAAFHVALRGRFTTRDRAPVIRFVGELRTSSDRTGDGIDPTLAESTIQSVLDGREPDAPFDPEKLAEIEFLAIVRILQDANPSDTELDDFFAASEVILKQYNNALSPRRAFLRTLVEPGYADPSGVAGTLDPNQTVPTITAAFAVATGRRFGNGEHLREIADYAAALPSRYENGADDIEPMVVEALIRTGFGEPNLLNGIDIEKLVSLEVFITYDLVSAEGLTTEQRDEFLDEVERTLD